MIDFSHEPIGFMLNKNYKGKIKPIINGEFVNGKQAVELCSEHGFNVTLSNLRWAVKTRRIKPNEERLLNAGDVLTWAQWRDFNGSFIPVSAWGYVFLRYIYDGYAFTSLFSGRRKKNNFVEAWHIALDFDKGNETSSLDALAQDDFAKRYASFGYTTPSHTAANPRCRLVFLLDQPVTSLAVYEMLYKALLEQFPHADKSAKDGLRLFYGSVGCETWQNWRGFTEGDIATIAADYAAKEVARVERPAAVIRLGHGRSAAYVRKALQNIVNDIRLAPQGQRHDILFKSSAAAGSLVASSWARLDRQQVFNQLVNACVWATNDTCEVERVINDGLDRGEPRQEPSHDVPSLGSFVN